MYVSIMKAIQFKTAEVAYLKNYRPLYIIQANIGNTVNMLETRQKPLGTPHIVVVWKIWYKN